MTQKQIENRALLVTVMVNALITAAGVWMYFLTDLKIMFLDGFFSMVALISTLMALLISRWSKKRTKHYPDGLFFLEPLYSVLKAALMIALMIYALVTSSQTAFDYFFAGQGQVMETAPIPAYALAMTVLCLGLAVFNRRQYRKTNGTSTMLRAEAQTNLIDGLQSAGIGTAVWLLGSIPLDSPLGFLHYTGDFFIAAVLVATALKEPIVLFGDSFRELTGGMTKDPAICKAVETATGLRPNAFTVYKTGMKIRVYIPVTDGSQIQTESREKMLQTLQKTYECAEILYIA